jgi:NH3-dependent NAD+ synthetase/predicted amidohydrolase
MISTDNTGNKGNEILPPAPPTAQVLKDAEATAQDLKDAEEKAEEKKRKQEAEEKKINDLLTSLNYNKSFVKLATCTLSQFVLDYKNNTDRIIDSIKVAKKMGCTYRVGPELEITGYSCEDHFYEIDTLEMSWLYLGKILEMMKSTELGMQDILCDIGTLVMHKGVRYNCRIFCLNGKILLIRPKMYLADDGNYREHRWFTGWQKHRIPLIEDCLLPKNIQEITGQTYAKFGVAILECSDGTTIASEICEELFTPDSPNIMLGLEGCDIISNGSGSHFQLGKRERRHQLIGEATKKNGGVYLYSNLVGCDGNRLVFDGNSMIYMNGKLIVCGEHLTWHEKEVVIATVDLNEVRGYRAAIVSSNDQSVHREIIVPRIRICDIFENDENCKGFKLTVEPKPTTVDNITEASVILDTEFKSLWRLNNLGGISDDKQYRVFSGEESRAEEEQEKKEEEEKKEETINFKEDNDQLPMELGDEIGLYTSRWIWDYTIRSNAGGYLLPLSGGVDSTSTAMIIYYMCDKISEILKYNNQNNNKAIENNKIILKENIKKKLENGFLNKNYKWNAEPELNDSSIDTITKEQLMFLLLHTANMPTKNNSEVTANSAANLAKELGSYHMMAPIQKAFEGFVPQPEVQDPVQNPIDYQVNNSNQIVKTTTITNPDFKFGYNKYSKPPGKLIEIIAEDGANTVDGVKYFQWENTNGMIVPQQIDKDGDKNQDLARQNVQARLRMITAYYLAQLLPIYRMAKRLGETTSKLDKDKNKERANAKFLLVLGSSNSDEALRGFFTKYDAASADINPIGSLSKTHLRKYLRWCGKKWSNFEEIIKGILDTVASPELRSSDTQGETETKTANLQDDETEIGMTYDQIYELGKLRKEEMLGPISMFKRLCPLWFGKEMLLIIKEENKENKETKIKVTRVLNYTDIANIVRTFFGWYCFNRNKMTIVPASVHGTGYSPDDNRYDLRPVFYPDFWSSETQKILLEMAKKMDQEKQPITGGSRYPKLTRRYKYKNKKYTRNKKH